MFCRELTAGVSSGSFGTDASELISILGKNLCSIDGFFLVELIKNAADALRRVSSQTLVRGRSDLFIKVRLSVWFGLLFVCILMLELRL